MAGNKLTVMKGQLTRYRRNGFLYQYKETLKDSEKQVFQDVINNENITYEEIEVLLKRLKDWRIGSNIKLSKKIKDKESNPITFQMSKYILNFSLNIESFASKMNDDEIELLKIPIEKIIDRLNELKTQKVKQQLKEKLNALSEMNESINELKLKLK